MKQVQVPWAEKGSRFTSLIERFAIQVLLATQNVKGAMSILQTKWDQTWSIVERAVARGKARKVENALPHLGIDEKAFLKGQNYITLLYDLDNSTVEAISDGNDTDSAIACLSQLLDVQIQSVEAIAMDMSAAYVKAAKHVTPLAENKIVHDRFHVMQMATKAVDKVRRGEHRQLMKDGDDCLSKTKYIWLTSFENLSEKQQAVFDATCAPDRKGVDLQGNASRSLQPNQCRVSDYLLQRLVQASDSHKARADKNRRKINQGTSAECRELLHSPNHERRGRRHEQQNHVHQTKSRWLPKPSKL